MLGFLLIDKPRGLTSHDVVARLRRTLGTKRIGHAGTLDPMATGLLVFGVGAATRFLPFLQLEPKEYSFTVEFGLETDTYDSEGTIVSQQPVPSDLEAQIRTHISSLTGAIEQIAPMYSAVKKDGRPLYSYARKGEHVERPARQIRIDQLSVRKVSGTIAEFHCLCSTGTYVRTIAHDLGALVGCGAHTTAIRRIRSGQFSVAEAIEWESASPGCLRDVAVALAPMPCITLTAIQSQSARNGQSVAVDSTIKEAAHVLLYGSDGSILGIAEVEGRELRPKCMVPVEEFVAPY